MLEDFTYNFQLQLRHEIVEGKQVKAEEKKIDYQYCEECNLERIMYPHLGFYVCPSCGVCSNDICVIGYHESTVMHKMRKCIYKRDEYFQSKIEKFLCQEPLNITDSVIQLLEGELHNSDNILYCYSQVDSLTIPILEQLLKKNKFIRYKRDIYNLYFTLTKKSPPQLSIRECKKAEMYSKLINKLYKKHLPNNWKSFLSYNFILQKILLVLGKVDYC